MASQTPNYDFLLPAVNSPTDEDLWGDELNDNFTSLDDLLFVATNWVKREVTGTDSATIADRNKIILGDATGGSYVQTLPLAATVGDGFAVILSKIDASVNTITVTRAGSDTIGGSNTYVLSTQNESIMIISDGVDAWNFQTKTAPLGTTSTAGLVRLADRAAVEAQTAGRVPTADVLRYHPGVAKATGLFDATGGTVSTFDYEYGCDTVTRVSLGVYDIVLDDDMASTDYVVVPGGKRTAGSGDVIFIITSRSVSGFRISTTTVSSNPTDAEVSFSVFGELA